MVRDMIALFPFIFLLSATGANVDIKLEYPRPDPPIVTVNVGDTVTWTVVGEGPNFVEEIGGPWKSPILSRVGDTFSITASKPGFCAYRTRNEAGTITIQPRPNSPRVVSINSPTEGMFVTGRGDALGIPIDASVSGNGPAIIRLDIYADEKLVGSAASPPYRVFWKNEPSTKTKFRLTAVAIDSSGLAWKSEPVTVNLLALHLSHPRILPDGSFLCYFSMPEGTDSCINIYNALPFCSELTNIIFGYGVFIDTQASSRSNRFYSPTGCNPPRPCTSP